MLIVQHALFLPFSSNLYLEFLDLASGDSKTLPCYLFEIYVIFAEFVSHSGGIVHLVVYILNLSEKLLLKKLLLLYRPEFS